ncbi:MAG TPA: glycosyltransferase family 4 protein [Patescibacteria group bacterium]|nr:glycosyltransferase family 4 protein [Patescibacteria group bacterium]
MKILYIVDYYQPQIGYSSYYVPKELVKLGHQVVILTCNLYFPFPNYKETAGKILGQREIATGVKTVEGVRVIRNKVWVEFFTRAYFGGQEKIIRSFKPDIVMVDKTAGFSQIVTCLLKYKYKFKLLSVDAHLPSGFKAEGNQLAKEIFYWLFRFLFSGLINSKVDKFIAVQEDTVEIMEKYYGINKNLVHIPLGTDTDLFHFDKEARFKLRDEYHIEHNDFVIIYTGKIIKEKGVHILFKAFNILVKRYKNIKMILVGSAPEDYKKICNSFLHDKYFDRVVWANFQKAKDLYKFYSMSDVAVWPLQESMSMNDAAACEIPFIANNTIGARVRLENNNALLYKKGNSSDLAKKIEYLYKNPKIRKLMGLRGRTLMIKKLSWKAISKQYLQSVE